MSLRGRMKVASGPDKVVYERPGLSSEEIDELHEAFKLFDADGTGEIDPQELKRAMQSLGYDVKNQMVYQVLESIDKDDAGGKTIDFNDFLDLMTARMSSKDSREDILKVFRLFDDDNKGKISLDNLRRVARELGEDMNEEELKEMITRADLDGDGLISEDEFYNIMTKKTFQ